MRVALSKSFSFFPSSSFFFPFPLFLSLNIAYANIHRQAFAPVLYVTCYVLRDIRRRHTVLRELPLAIFRCGEGDVPKYTPGYIDETQLSLEHGNEGKQEHRHRWGKIELWETNQLFYWVMFKHWPYFFFPLFLFSILCLHVNVLINSSLELAGKFTFHNWTHPFFTSGFSASFFTFE